MVESFKNGAHRLTPENKETELKKMEELVENFDFDIFFGEENTFLKEENFVRYLGKVFDQRYIMFVATQSDVPVSIHEIFGNQYMQQEYEKSESGNGYVAVICGGKVTFQELSDNIIKFKGVVDELEVIMVSENRDRITEAGREGYVEVVINNVRYTTNQAGVNIVVYDKELKRVLDNFAVDIESGSINRR